MRAAYLLIRPFTHLKPMLRSHFSSMHSQRIQDIKKVFRMHEENLKSPQLFNQHFTDQYLYDLVDQNYCFSDLVDISNSLVYHRTQNKSDIQIMFLAYAYNLYYNQLKRGKEVIISINAALKDKISNKNFIFETIPLEKHFLTNIKSLTNRYNNFLGEEVAALKNTYFRFLTLKYDVADESGKFKTITDRTIGQLLTMMPLVPKESVGCKYLIQLEKWYLYVLKYEIKEFLARPDSEVTRNFMRNTTTRFVLLMEIAVMLGKLSQRYLNIFPYLPSSFASQAKFTNYLHIMREYFTYQMLSRLDYKQFDDYNQLLSNSNLAYRSPETVLAFEKYVESLIVLKKNNLKVFASYLGYEDSLVENNKQQDEIPSNKEGKYGGDGYPGNR